MRASVLWWDLKTTSPECKPTLMASAASLLGKAFCNAMAAAQGLRNACPSCVSGRAKKRYHDAVAREVRTTGSPETFSTVSHATASYSRPQSFHRLFRIKPGDQPGESTISANRARGLLALVMSTMVRLLCSGNTCDIEQCRAVSTGSVPQGNSRRPHFGQNHTDARAHSFSQ